MPTPIEMDIGPIRPDEIDALDSVIGPALHFPPGLMSTFAQKIGLEEFRVVRSRGRVVAGLASIMMGQWFSGVRMPLAGVSAVGVAPDMRGTGVGSAMLRATLAELRERKVPLAALYPATLPYYQRAGFERAGYRLTYEMSLDAIDIHAGSLEILPVGPQNYGELRRIYEQRATHAAGNLDRPDWMWKDRMEPPDKQPFRYRVVNKGQTEGYIVYTQGGRTDPLMVTDVCVLTPAAGRSLLSILGGYRSMVEKAIWNGGPLDPFRFLINENLTAGMHAKAQIIRPNEWMLRIVDVPDALTMRLYPLGLMAALHLDVRDDVLPDNNGRFVLKIADGHGEVRPGGEGRIQFHVRDLAALYTGFMTPAERRVIGTLEGPPNDLALMGAVFAGPQPWIADMF